MFALTFADVLGRTAQPDVGAQLKGPPPGRGHLGRAGAHGDGRAARRGRRDVDRRRRRSFPLTCRGQADGPGGGALYAYFELTRLPTQDEQDAADAAVAATGSSRPLTVERGYVSGYGLGLLALSPAAAVITLGAAGIATGLAQADARADHATLAGVPFLAAAAAWACTGSRLPLGRRLEA